MISQTAAESRQQHTTKQATISRNANRVSSEPPLYQESWDCGPNKVRSGKDEGNCQENTLNTSLSFARKFAKLVVESNRSIAEVAREYGLNETTVGNWVKNYRATHAADEPPLELSERARLRELERRNRELEIENAFLKK